MRLFLRSAALACLLAAASAAPAHAQSPAPAAGPNIFGNMPGAVLLLVPLAIGGAVYISRRIGSARESEQRPRREGAVSRALARREAKP